MQIKKLSRLSFWQRCGAFIAALGLVLGIITPVAVSAGSLTARSLTLSSSSSTASNATTVYTFNFTTGSTNTWQSFDALICDAPSGACSTPSGFANSSSTFSSSNLSGAWTVNTATAGDIRASATGASSTSSGAAKQIVFGAVQNPTTANQTFYARLTLYTTNNWTGGSQDTGTVAASTSTQISLSGTMDESLVFCTGTSITGTNCGTIAGSAVAFGSFSSVATKTGTSVMAASTNGNSGYNVTVTGTTLTCGACGGSPTIAAMGTQSTNGSAAASSIGSAQFGVNFRANTTPSVGANVSGSGSGTYGTNYGTVDNFRFFTGDTVATAASSTDANAFTASYIVNVPGSQQAGTYTTTLTYICTATF